MAFKLWACRLVKPNIKVANTQKIVLMTLYFKELRMQK